MPRFRGPILSTTSDRRLAAILAADVAGNSRLVEVDEAGALEKLAKQRALLDAAIARHSGRVANTAGDSVLAEFDGSQRDK